MNASSAPISLWAPRDAQDTFYLSVETEGTASRAVLKVRWLRGTEVLAETQQAIAADAPAVSEFHLGKAGGWPPAEYAVELLVDQVPAGRRGFSVKETPPYRHSVLTAATGVPVNGAASVRI